MEEAKYYLPEILTRLIREGFEVRNRYETAKRGKGVLTLCEAEEDFIYWKERMHKVYEMLGWDSKLVDFLVNN